ncbi:MAG: aldo/keto reductase, partial [Rhodobacteraceae bacterium]
TSEREAHDTLAAARDLGIDFLDTANVYGLGLSEEIIGRFLKGDSGPFTIATKAGIWRDREHGNRGFRNDAAYLRAELEGSLRRLGLDRVDLFYVHRRDPAIEIEEVMESLLALKAEGKIGGIGFSEIAPASLRRALAVGPVDAVQSEYSLWTRQPDLGLRQACGDLGVALVAYAPLGRGIFADRTPDPALFAEQDFRKHNPRFIAPNFERNVARVAEFRAYAADHGATTSAMALAWCLARGENIIPIPGTRTAAHLAECARGASIDLTDAMMDEIERILPVGWAHGDRYSPAQWNGPERYC